MPAAPQLPLPLFIVFEGIDGSGKTTQAELFAMRLRASGYDVAQLREPTDGPWGRKIREMLRGPVAPPAAAQVDLFIRDREDDAARNIRPALEAGRIVVMDRYYYSNAAYQGAFDYPPGDILRLNRERGFPAPDLVYFIDIPPALAVERITGRGGAAGRELFEKRALLERVRELYLAMADRTFCIIDGAGPVEEVLAKVLADFHERFRSACR